MGDRNEYMREYMREYRAKRKAERLAYEADNFTEEEEEETTGRGGSLPWWVWAGIAAIVIVVACVQGGRDTRPVSSLDNWTPPDTTSSLLTSAQHRTSF